MSDVLSWLRDRRVLAVVVGIVAVVVISDALDRGHPVCSVAQPCLPSRFGSTALGLLIGSILVVYLHRSTAAWLAVAAAVAIVIADLIDPTMPTWGYLVLLCYVAGYRYLLIGAPRPAAADVAWAGTAQPDRSVPRPARVPVLGRYRLAIAVVLLAVAGATAWWGLAEQGRRDTERLERRQVTGVVSEQADEYTVGVALPDGHTVDVDVLDAADYPVGGRMTLYTDGRHLYQPVSEPYDATGWLVLAALAASVAAACGARVVGANLGLRRLLATAQPVRTLRAVEYSDVVFVHLPGQRPGRIAAATVRRSRWTRSPARTRRWPTSPRSTRRRSPTSTG